MSVLLAIRCYCFAQSQLQYIVQMYGDPLQYYCSHGQVAMHKRPLMLSASGARQC